MEAQQSLIMNWRSLALGGIVLFAQLAQLYLLAKGIERKATIWLALFMAAIAVNVSPMVIGFAGAYDIWPGLTFLPVDLTLFFGPLIYFHARQLMEGISPAEQFWWLAPGFAHWFYQLWAFTMLGDYRAKWAFNDAVHEPYIFPLTSLLAIAINAWALWTVWRMRQRYLTWLEASRSDGEDFDPVWIKHFLVLGAIAAVIWVGETVLYLTLGLSYFQSFWWDLASLFFIMLLSMEALARLEKPFPKMLAPDAITIEELMDATAAERDWMLEGEKLRAMVMENGWHLESSLSLQTLSRRFGMNQAYVSRALNQGLSLSFSQFINGLRVEHAKKMIAREDVNLLDVALSSGFGSKASFNRAFKLHTGDSPSGFKRLNS